MEEMNSKLYQDLQNIGAAPLELIGSFKRCL